jgi:hypothetical protein
MNVRTGQADFPLTREEFWHRFGAQFADRRRLEEPRPK